MMTFLMNILLALAWAAFVGEFNAFNLGVGFTLGYFLLGLMQTRARRGGYFRKGPRILGFWIFFLWELFLSNLRVAYDVITPRSRSRPVIVAIPLVVQSDEEIAILANLITLTPGTMSLDVSTDRKVLYVHAMFATDVDQFRRQIKDGFERRVLEVFR